MQDEGTAGAARGGNICGTGRRMLLDPEGRVSAILGPRRWDNDDVVFLKPRSPSRSRVGENARMERPYRSHAGQMDAIGNGTLEPF